MRSFPFCRAFVFVCVCTIYDQVWPIYDMILYAYVPTAHRPLFNSFMSILWGGYLSHVSQPAEAEDEVEGIQEATS